MYFAPQAFTPLVFDQLMVCHLSFSLLLFSLELDQLCHILIICLFFLHFTLFHDQLITFMPAALQPIANLLPYRSISLPSSRLAIHRLRLFSLISCHNIFSSKAHLLDYSLPLIGLRNTNSLWFPHGQMRWPNQPPEIMCSNAI